MTTEIKSVVRELFNSNPELTSDALTSTIKEVWKEIQDAKMAALKEQIETFAKAAGIALEDVGAMFAPTKKVDTTKGSKRADKAPKQSNAEVIWLDIGGGMPCILAGPLPKEIKLAGGDRKTTPRLDPSEYHKIDPVVWEAAQRKWPQIGDQPNS